MITPENKYPFISALILAAGRSRRMGQPKLVLPWGETTVIGRVVDVLAVSGIQNTVVVTGGWQTEVRNALVTHLEYKNLHLILNLDFQRGEMLSSVKLGLQNLPGSSRFAMITLGDQPQIEHGVVQQLLEKTVKNDAALIVPSFQMRRGHPWVVARRLWGEIIDLPSNGTLRNFFATHAKEIEYVEVNTPSVLQDLDTPADYDKYRPGTNSP